MGGKGLWVLVNFYNWDMISRIFEGDHLPLQHAEYRSSGPSVFREEEFRRYFYYKSLGANEPLGVANVDPRVTVGMINVRHQFTLLHTAYLISLLNGFKYDY